MLPLLHLTALPKLRFHSQKNNGKNTGLQRLTSPFVFRNGTEASQRPCSTVPLCATIQLTHVASRYSFYQIKGGWQSEGRLGPIIRFPFLEDYNVAHSNCTFLLPSWLDDNLTPLYSLHWCLTDDYHNGLSLYFLKCGVGSLW